MLGRSHYTDTSMKFQSINLNMYHCIYKEGQSLYNIFNSKHILCAFLRHNASVHCPSCTMLTWCLDVSDQHVKHVQTSFWVTMHSVFQWSCNLKSKVNTLLVTHLQNIAIQDSEWKYRRSFTQMIKSSVEQANHARYI